MWELILEALKQTGLAFLAVVAILWAFRKDKEARLARAEKDKQIISLYDRLEAKSETYVEKYMSLSKELNDTVASLADALDVEVDS